MKKIILVQLSAMFCLASLASAQELPPPAMSVGVTWCMKLCTFRRGK